MSEIETVGVLGSGAWGTALAVVCARAGRRVVLWSHDPAVAASIAETAENAVYLPGVTLPSEVHSTAELGVVGACDLVLAVPPAQHMRAVLAAFAPHARPGAPVALCAKGVEQGSLKLMADGLSPETPVAILERGTLPDARAFRTLLADLGGAVARKRVRSPAVLVIGDVARLGDCEDVLAGYAAHVEAEALA